MRPFDPLTKSALIEPPTTHSFLIHQALHSIYQLLEVSRVTYSKSQCAKTVYLDLARLEYLHPYKQVQICYYLSVTLS